MRYLYRLSQSLFVVAIFVVAAPVWAQSDACGTSPIDYADDADLTQEERIRRMDAALMRSLNQYDECQDDEARAREKERNDPEPEQQSAVGEGASSTAAEGSDPGDGSDGAGADREADAESEGQSEGNGEGTASAAAGDISGSDPGAGSDPSGAMVLPGVVPSLPSGQTGAQGEGGLSNTRNGSARASGIGGEAGSENLPAGSSSAASGDMAGTEPVAPPRRAGVTGVARENEGPQTGSGGSRENTDVAGTGPKALPNGKLPEDIPPADNDSVLEAQIRQAAINETDPELKKKLWNEYRRYKGLPQVN